MNVFEFTTINSMAFKSFFNSIKNVLTDVTMSMKPDGLEITNIDDKQTFLINMTMNIYQYGLWLK